MVGGSEPVFGVDVLESLLRLAPQAVPVAPAGQFYGGKALV